MDINKLKGRMREKGYTQANLSRKMGISEQSLNAKINGRSDFTLSEVIIIIEVLELDNPAEYFFAKNVPNMQQNNELTGGDKN